MVMSSDRKHVATKTSKKAIICNWRMVLRGLASCIVRLMKGDLLALFFYIYICLLFFCIECSPCRPFGDYTSAIQVISRPLLGQSVINRVQGYTRSYKLRNNRRS